LTTFRFRITPLILVSFILLAGCMRDNPTQFYKMIKVDGLFSLTGNWSTLGVASEAALQIGVVDANLYFQRNNIPYRLLGMVHDTKLEPQSASSFFGQASADGTRFIIGPQSSAELAAIKPLADAANILLISQGSTAGSLAISGDAIYRFCPADKVEGGKIAESIYDSGIRALITVARNDAGNTGLQTSTGNAFTTVGGLVETTTPYAIDQSDFSALLTDIHNRLTTLKQTYPVEQIGIYLASFDECVSLFNQASADPDLKKVRWFGGDGVTKSTALQSDAVAAAFADSTKFFAPEFGIPSTSEALAMPIASRIKKKTGENPDAFALAVYDAVMVIAKSIEASDGLPEDLPALLSAFNIQAASYSGITGPTVLDAAGDRADGAFNYWGLRKTNGSYQWVLVGKSK